MFFYVAIGAIVALVLVYEHILRSERKEHRAEVNHLLDSAEAERRDLYNRIMSGSIYQYQTATTEKPKVKKPTNYLKSKLDEADRQ
jgi:hypothetical protein